MAYNPEAQTVSRINAGENGGALQEYQQPEVQMAPSFMGMTPSVAREVATVQGQIMIAKAFPRNMKDVWNKVEAACQRKSLAEKAIYRYARGGTDISGPSIRLAEALINAYGNAKAGFEIISSDSESSRVRAYAYDMETNTIQERTFDVPHIRQTKTGRTKLTDPRDIYEAVANQAQRRVRACALSILPGDMVELGVNACRKTMEKSIDLNPSKIRNLVEAFVKYEVSQVMIEARIQRNVDAMTVEQFVDLMNVGNSLRDGIGKVEDFFDKDAKPIGGNASSAAAPEKPKAAPRKAAAKTQQAAPAPAAPKAEEAKAAQPAAAPASEPEGPSIPDDVWGQTVQQPASGEDLPLMNENGELIGPEGFEDDDDFFNR